MVELLKQEAAGAGAGRLRAEEEDEVDDGDEAVGMEGRREHESGRLVSSARWNGGCKRARAPINNLRMESRQVKLTRGTNRRRVGARAVGAIQDYASLEVSRRFLYNVTFILSRLTI